jgi:hypothetical protein
MLRKSQLTGTDYKEAINILNCSMQREISVLQSVPELLPGNAFLQKTADAYIKKIEKETELNRFFLEDGYSFLCRNRGKKPEDVKISEQEKEADMLFPRRNPDFPGPISQDYFAEKMEQKKIDFHNPFTPFQLYEIGAFINGERSVLDIRNAVSAECGPVRLSDVLHYLEILEAVDLVSFEEQQQNRH